MLLHLCEFLEQAVVIYSNSTSVIVFDGEKERLIVEGRKGTFWSDGKGTFFMGVDNCQDSSN